MKDSVCLRIDYILKSSKEKSVLHVGCTNSPYTQRSIDDGSLLHTKLANVASKLYGIDLDEEGINIMQNAGIKNLAAANVEDLVDKNPFDRIDFDIIIAGEIIEHLSNPGQFLDSMKPILLNPGSRLLITTVNAFNAMRFFLGMFSGKESVHPDHVSYYSKSTLFKLLEIHGFEVENFSYYSISEDYQKHLKKGKRWILYFIDRFATKFLPPLLSDGVIVTCKLKLNK